MASNKNWIQYGYDLEISINPINNKKSYSW
jgi:hypothetical protein